MFSLSDIRKSFVKKAKKVFTKIFYIVSSHENHDQDQDRTDSRDFTLEAGMVDTEYSRSVSTAVEALTYNDHDNIPPSHPDHVFIEISEEVLNNSYPLSTQKDIPDCHPCDDSTAPPIHPAIAKAKMQNKDAPVYPPVVFVEIPTSSGLRSLALSDRPLERLSKDFGQHSGEINNRPLCPEKKKLAHQKLKEARHELLFDRCAKNPGESFESLAMRLTPLPLTPSDTTIKLSEINEFEEEMRVTKEKWDVQIRMKTKSIWQRQLWHKLQREDACRRERERSKFCLDEEPISE
ncbi:hypothetical protein MP638_006222 [Amoeboaphelidium occidentale]|nr:hypothetical protein MP638_006222 [Amoeboaphelidium occidentale]